MGKLSVGTVVLSRFPFSDLSTDKVRPCLIVGLAEFGDVIVCQITSKAYSSNCAIPLSKTNFTSGSIVVKSFIRPNKIATLDSSMIVQELGIINDKKLGQVKTAIRQLFE